MVYGRALFNGFVWDDEEQILNNNLVHSISNIPLLFKNSTFNFGSSGTLSGVYYRPVMMIAFAGLYQLFGPNPFWFHFLQILIHIVNSLILYLIFKRYFKKEVSFFLSLIFLVHPANVEAVAYISALQDTLVVFFSLLAFYFSSVIFTPILMLFALLYKETVAFSMAIFLFGRFIFQKSKVWAYTAGFVGVGIAYIVLRFAVAGIFFTPYKFAPIVQLNFWQRLAMTPAIFTYYLNLFFWPVSLAVMQHWVIKEMTLTGFYLPFAAALGFLALSLTYLAVKRDKIFGFFFGWFILGILPYLQFFPLDMTVAERWFYFPMIGLLGMGGVVLTKTAEVIPTTRRGSPPRILLLVAVVGIILILSTRSFVRTFDWQNGLTLYGHDIQVSHSAFDLENNYGVELFRIGKLDEAAVHFQTSIALAPTWWTNYNNLGAYYQHKGELAKAEVLYKKSIVNGNYYLAYENLAFILIREKKYTEDIAFLEKSLQLLPQNPRLITALAIAYYEAGDRAKALSTAEYLMKISPTDESKMILEKISANGLLPF